MRIGVNALFSASGGSLTNLLQLLREWHRSGALARHELVLFAGPSAREALQKGLPAAVLADLTIEEHAAADRGLLGRLRVEQLLLPRRLRARRIDVLFCPANVIPYFTRVPTVVTFQNAAPFCESVTRRSLRDRRWWIRFRMLGWFVRASARRATRVIFISRWFRDLFVSRYGFEPARGEVVLRGTVERAAPQRDEMLERSLGIAGPFLLYVSHLNPYKNVLELIDGFVDACAALGDRGHQLVIAGQVNFPWYHQAILERIEARGVRGRVILTGALPQRSVQALLAGCEAFVFASTCENCPTALLEALSFGLPVASSNAGVMPEVGGDAVEYFDPFDVASIRDVLARLMSDAALRAQLAAKASARAKTFAGEAEVAMRTLAVIESAAS